MSREWKVTVQLTESELACTFGCVQSSLDINVRYEKHTQGKEKAETLELIKTLQRVKAKLLHTMEVLARDKEGL